MKSFPGQMLVVQQLQPRRQQGAVLVWSDRHHGAITSTTAQRRRCRRSSTTSPGSSRTQMAPTRPIEFTAATARSCLASTPPRGTGPQAAWSCMPHGGPYWHPRHLGFRPRGAVPRQPRLRRAAGRITAVPAVVAKRSSSPGWTGNGAARSRTTLPTACSGRSTTSWRTRKRICIFGASFGGYSALMQPILQPGHVQVRDRLRRRL